MYSVAKRFDIIFEFDTKAWLGKCEPDTIVR